MKEHTDGATPEAQPQGHYSAMHLFPLIRERRIADGFLMVAQPKKTKEDKTRRKNKSTNRGINLNGSWHKDHSHHIQYPDFSRSSIWDLTLLSSEHKLFPNHSSGIEGLLV